jgi:hypothetical protein
MVIISLSSDIPGYAMKQDNDMMMQLYSCKNNNGL